VAKDMPGRRDSRPDHGQGTENENAEQDSHRGEDNKWEGNGTMGGERVFRDLAEGMIRSIPDVSAAWLS